MLVCGDLTGIRIRGMEKRVLKFGDIKGGLNYCAGAKWNKYNREVMPSKLQSQQCALQ